MHDSSNDLQCQSLTVSEAVVQASSRDVIRWKQMLFPALIDDTKPSPALRGAGACALQRQASCGQARCTSCSSPGEQKPPSCWQTPE